MDFLMSLFYFFSYFFPSMFLLIDILLISSFFQSQEIKANAQKYIRQIADVLAYVNREMILIFKTNDLLRAIEHSLGTQNSMSAFIQMSRACFNCLNDFK